ncbi:hypothetical protein [Nostoc favosum]|uniref:Uncharacterized protein n=1 Tax=Nostoc favosum CHAB5714 TaxID=2780399 RepID=A0ABS8I1B3_9NOSO|nr:hypothetical protein [Nostoc favosum]MCC5598001.1 hypothetical protein [Nostoc favosum CHAB5714]
MLNFSSLTQQNSGEWGDEGDEEVGEDRDNYHNSCTDAINRVCTPNSKLLTPNS